MSSGRTARHSRDDLRRPSDWSAFDAITDKDIRAGVSADPDAAPLIDETWLENARIAEPETKVTVTMRLDPDIVAFFEASGPGYQTRINRVLRAFVDHELSKKDA